MGSDLYQRQIAHCNDALMHQVWDATPWMVAAFTGSPDDDRSREIMEWCRDEFGPEAWPIHDKPGDWHSGGAIIDGWAWMGFSTQEQIDTFIARWGARA